LCSTHISHGSSGFNKDVIISGRPYGGCAILWRADIEAQVFFVETNNNRICCIRVCNDTNKLLLINVYMPYESDAAAADEFSSVLADVIAIIDQFDDHCFVLGGDFNVDFTKHKTHPRLLRDICDVNNLRIATLHNNSSIDFTYNFDMSRFSFIDHFIVSENVYASFIDSCSVRHDGENLSDHDPITLSLTIDWSTIDRVSRHYASTCRWHKANAADLLSYKSSLKASLDTLRIPVNAITCHNVTCNNKSHFAALNDYSNALINACLDSANRTIPHTAHPSDVHHNNVMPGWNEYVAPLRDKSVLWHDIWVECGRPHDGIVAGIMRRTRASYHYAVRYIKNNKLDIIKERFASAILENRGRDFWFEAKKVCGGKSCPPSNVDGLSQSEEIADLFARKYEDLYSCVSFNENEMASLQRDLNDKINVSGYNEHCIMTVQDVVDAVSRIKSGKHDGYLGLSSDHVKHACHELFIHLSMMFNALIVHGSITDDLSSSTVLPIPKGKNLNYSDSTNYRGIALSSILGKIFDSYVLNRYDSILTSSNLQFGFKAGYSTSMCSMILKETLEYYRRNKSTVYCTMLDATKAFDRVEYCKLVRLLLKKNVPPIIIRILLHMYLFHFTKVAWNRTCSNSFRVLNGVRQGAILSPVLFCVYFDTLLISLSKADIGCHIGSFFVGALAYADDLVLLAPSANAMRCMLRICDDYAAQFKVVFNASKSKCLCCPPTGTAKHVPQDARSPSFSIGSQKIEFVDKWPHLGHIITNECVDTDDILVKKSSLIGQINRVLYNFRKVNCQTKTRLVKAYCTSFYGAELWDLSQNSIESICTAWRKGIRRIWQLPNTTHSALIPELSDTLPLLDMFYMRMLNFVYRCLRSESALINFMARHGIIHGQMDSIIGRNILNCSFRYDTSLVDIVNLQFQPRDIYSYFRANTDISVLLYPLIELLHCRDGSLSLSSGDFNMADISSMIDSICTC
jgi:hypothetical protein